MEGVMLWTLFPFFLSKLSFFLDKHCQNLVDFKATNLLPFYNKHCDSVNLHLLKVFKETIFYFKIVERDNDFSSNFLGDVIFW